MGNTTEVEKQMQYVYYRQYGQTIYFRYKEYRDTVTHSDVITDYEPTLYTPTPMTTGLTSIYGENVAPTTYPTIKAAREAAEKYRGMGAKVYGNPKAANQFVIDLYEGKPVDFNTDIIRIGFIDIEVDISRDSGFPFPEQAKRPINAITMFDTVDKKFYIWGLTRLDGQAFDPDNLQTEQARETAKRYPIEYRHYTDEVALIKNFLEHLRDQPLDYISGWNSETFDLPYIWYRCVKKVGQDFTESCLSPFGIVKTREKEGKYGKTYTDVEIFGTTHLDYLNVYRKFVLKPRASYKLDDIAEVELDKQKISYDGTLFDLYENDYQRFIEYNFIDVGLMVDIDAKLKLFNIAFAVIYKTYCRPSDVLGTTGVWESNIAGYLYAKNTVPLYFQLPSAKRPYEGAYVKEPIPGKYQYMISIDLNSLYPHLIKECKIGPETLVPRDRVPANMQHFMDYEVDDYVNQLVDTSALKGTNYSLSPSGQLYDKSKECFLYDMMTETYGDRKIVKARGIKVHRNRRIALIDEINRRRLDVTLNVKMDDTSFYYEDDASKLTDDQILAAYRFHAEEETKCDLLQHALKILN